jgi:hypothetical protein
MTLQHIQIELNETYSLPKGLFIRLAHYDRDSGTMRLLLTDEEPTKRS